MVVVDATIVNIALPSAQRALHFANSERQWIVTAYALAFGSLLLLGGRISDLFGRKWTFIAGLAGFATASAVGGAAQSFGMLADLLGILGHDPNPALTYPFGAAALIATALVLALPTVLQHLPLRPSQAGRSNRVTSALRLLRYAVTEGVRDGLVMLRQRPLGVIGGSLGTMVFDLAVLGVSFRAFRDCWRRDRRARRATKAGPASSTARRQARGCPTVPDRHLRPVDRRAGSEDCTSVPEHSCLEA